MVWRRAHLLKSTPYATSEQLPSSVHERRRAQIPILTSLQKEAQETNSHTSVKLIKDKLFVDNKVKSDLFENKALDLTISVGDAISYEALYHSDPVTVKGSTFQGHYYLVHCMEDAVKSLMALLQSKVISKSHHIIYTYNYLDVNGQQVSGNSDDGEWSASCLLKDKLKCFQGILMVTRRHDGPNLGKQRFERKLWGHGGRVATLSPPTSEAGVRFPAWPQVGKLVDACCWSAVYSTEP